MNPDHPSFDIIGTDGSALSGKKIALGISGSVAVLKTIELARLLMRQGAQVIPFLSEAASKLVGPDLVHWATGYKPIMELSGDIEHVWAAGNVPDKVDLIVVAPATANTIGKIAAGIDDTVVTTLVTTGFGEGIPLIIVPAMHEPMYRHPIVKDNIDKLTALGVKFLVPRIEEGKAKLETPENLLEAIIEHLDSGAKRIGFINGSSSHSGIDLPLVGKRILISAGRTVEYLDPIRVISNNSTGKMGMALANAALELGASVTVVYGKGTAESPSDAHTIKIDTAEEMKSAIETELLSKPYDVFISAAAVGDWKVDDPSKVKISTHETKKLTLELVPTPKIIDSIKTQFPDLYLVAFRAQHDLKENDLLDDARARMKKAKADMIVVNDVSKEGHGFESDSNEVFIIDSQNLTEKFSLASKTEIARKILKKIAFKLSS